jgi:hypothetical protein
MSDLTKFFHDAYKQITEADFYKKHVEFQNDPNQIASSEATIIGATCPVWSKYSSYVNSFTNMDPKYPAILPLGAVMNFSLQEVLNNIPTPEIGSKIKRVIFGKANYSIQISKLLTQHANIVRSLYHWIYALKLETNLEFPTTTGPNNHHIIGMESDLFNYPFGLVFGFYTAGGKLISIAFAENNFIMSTGNTLEASGGFIVDGLSIMTSGVYTGIYDVNENKVVTIGNGEFPDTQKKQTQTSTDPAFPLQASKPTSPPQ